MPFSFDITHKVVFKRFTLEYFSQNRTDLTKDTSLFVDAFPSGNNLNEARRETENNDKGKKKAR